jgi:hypothetical protein
MGMRRRSAISTLPIAGSTAECRGLWPAPVSARGHIPADPLEGGDALNATHSAIARVNGQRFPAAARALDRPEIRPQAKLFKARFAFLGTNKSQDCVRETIRGPLLSEWADDTWPVRQVTDLHRP